MNPRCSSLRNLSYTRLRKWLVLRGLRQLVSLDACEMRAISDLDAGRLRLIVKAAKRLGRYAPGGALDKVFPALTRNEELPRQLLGIEPKGLPVVAAELARLQAAASADGAVASLAASIYEQMAAPLAAKLPFGCRLLDEVCTGELKRTLAKGWHPQVAGSIFLCRFFSNPRQYSRAMMEIPELDPLLRSSSAAPYRSSRSEMRG